jgi:hypothetical protein
LSTGDRIFYVRKALLTPRNRKIMHNTADRGALTQKARQTPHPNINKTPLSITSLYRLRAELSGAKIRAEKYD